MATSAAKLTYSIRARRSVEEYGVGTLDGWRKFTLADGSQPMWLKSILKLIDDEEAYDLEQKNESGTRFTEYLNVDKGTVARVGELGTQLEQLSIRARRSVEEYGVGTLDGWRKFTLADGSQPMWLKSILKLIDDEEAYDLEQKNESGTRFTEYLNVDKGTVARVGELGTQLEQLSESLNKALPRRQREHLEGMQDEARAEFVKCSEHLEVSERTSGNDLATDGYTHY